MFLSPSLFMVDSQGVFYGCAVVLTDNFAIIPPIIIDYIALYVSHSSCNKACGWVISSIFCKSIGFSKIFYQLHAGTFVFSALKILCISYRNI